MLVFILSVCSENSLGMLVILSLSAVIANVFRPETANTWPNCLAPCQWLEILRISFRWLPCKWQRHRLSHWISDTMNTRTIYSPCHARYTLSYLHQRYFGALPRGTAWTGCLASPVWCSGCHPASGGWGGISDNISGELISMRSSV